jgi:hypothetical protein
MFLASTYYGLLFSRWILPAAGAKIGNDIAINLEELRDHRFFPELGQVRTYAIGISVFKHKTPFGRFTINSKAENPGWRIPAGLQWNYGMS